MPNRYEDALNRAAQKYRRTAQQAAEQGIIPYKSERGAWIPSPYAGNGWWTGGILAGADVAAVCQNQG